MLGRDELASGVTLDREAARASLEELGRLVALDPNETARGVLAITSAQMAGAIRSITVEVGEDPRDATLIAFGGAGPLFANLLAQELEIPDIVIPPHAGGFSAWGLLGQDVTQAAARTLLRDLDDTGLAAATSVVQELVELLRDRTDSASSETDVTTEVSLDLRYAGQDYSLPIPASLGRAEKLSDPDALRAAFEQDYARAYGHTMASRVQIVTVRVTARTLLDRPDDTTAVGSDAPHRAQSDLPAFSFVANDWLDFAIVSRVSLSSGDSLSGPCIVLEPTTTTYLDIGSTLTVHESGALLVKTCGKGP
jgi:N-methylhydantoinase A